MNKIQDKRLQKVLLKNTKKLLKIQEKSNMISSQMMRGQGKYWSKIRSVQLEFDTLNNSYRKLIFM